MTERRRVLCVGDSHFDERSRFDECVRIHDWIAEQAFSVEADLLVHCGDVYERASTPKERAAVARWLTMVADVCPVLIVRGNHDKLGDLPLLSRLRTRHPIIVEESAGVHEIAGMNIAALAWPRRAQLEAMWRETHGRTPTADESATAAREAVRSVLSAMGTKRPALLASHAMVRGSLTSTGQPLVGCDMELGLEDLRAAGCPVVLGHIHKQQDWGVNDTPMSVIYTGSPRRTAFGESEEKSILELSYVRCETSGWALETIEHTVTPCSDMHLLDGAASEDGISVELPETVFGAEVRLRYQVSRADRDAAKAKAAELRKAMLDEGAKCVVIEERVIAESTARAPEVASRSSLEDKLRVLWSARRDAIAEAEMQRVFSLVGELTQEAC